MTRKPSTRAEKDEKQARERRADLRRYREFAAKTLEDELPVAGSAGPWESSPGGPRPKGVETREEYERALLALVRIGNAAWHQHRLRRKARRGKA